MPRYCVTVSFTQRKEINVWARDESEAEEKAVSIVEGWNNVDSADADGVEEIDA